MSFRLLRPTDEFELVLQADEAADDSDKVLTVPDFAVWRLQSLWVELTSSADVGNRQLEVQIRDDSDDVVARFVAGAGKAASLTRHYLFAPGVPDLTAFRDTDLISNPIPDVYLPAGWDIRIFDNNAVAAAADDMIVQAVVHEQS